MNTTPNHDEPWARALALAWLGLALLLGSVDGRHSTIATDYDSGSLRGGSAGEPDQYREGSSRD